MKIKLFENFEKNELLQSVTECFQDLIDDEIVEIANDLDDSFKQSVVLSCSVPNFKTESNSFDDFFSLKKKHFEVISEIMSSLERVRKHHNDTVDINFEYYDNEDYLQIDLYINEGDPEVGDFWKISKDGLIRIDYDKLKKHLKLPNNCQISMSSTGSNKILSIYFKTEEDLELFKDKIIKFLSEVKIQDKNIIEKRDWVYPASKPEDKGEYKIYKNYNRHRSTGYYDNKKDIVHYISFSLNSKLNIFW